MKVRELIKELQLLDPEQQLYLEDRPEGLHGIKNYYEVFEIQSIKVNKDEHGDYYENPNAFHETPYEIETIVTL